MKNWGGVVQKFVFTGTVFGFFLVGGLVQGAEEGGDMTARVVSINGVAKVDGKGLVAGASVAQGAWIQTEKGAGVKLLLPDRSIVDIGPATQFRVQSATASSTDGQLQWGSVRALIQKKLEGKTKFRVRTKSSVLSARGTEFVASSFPKEGSKSQFVDQVTVKSGVVEVQAPGVAAVMLDAGKQVTALAKLDGQGVAQLQNKDLKPVTLGSDAVQKAVAVATVSDNTFKQVVVVPAQGGDRSPNAEGPKGPQGPQGHFGQDALASVNFKASSDTEGQGMSPMGQPFQGLRPRDQTSLGNLNNVAGSNAEKIVNQGVNVTVVFQL